MTVFEYVTKNNIPWFWCSTTSGITLTHKHKSRKGRVETITEFFTRQNLCILGVWDNYKSFSSFSKKEVVKVSNNGDIPFIYVIFSKEDWERETKETFLEDEKNYDYSFSM